MTDQPKPCSGPIIVALDFAGRDEALRLLSALDPARCRVKVGKALFTAAGPDIVRDIIAAGFQVFLDLKFHDIPATAAGAVRAAAELGVWMVNVHAAGGLPMMVAAREALRDCEPRPKLVGVTVLTSMDGPTLAAVGVPVEPVEQVLRLARLCHDAALDGVVCSAREAQRLRAEFPRDFLLVTPGIRPPTAGADDQARVAGPREALAMGSDYLVIGRPISRARQPSQALDNFISALGGETPVP